MKKGATVSRSGALHVLFMLTLTACLVSSSAEARRGHWRHFYGVYDYGYVVRPGDDGRRERVSEVIERPRALGRDALMFRSHGCGGLIPVRPLIMHELTNGSG
jgi:hypothetical protein